MSRRSLLVFLVLGAALVLGLLLTDRPRPTSPLPSTFNPSPRGLKGIYLSLQRSGIPATRLLSPWTELPETSGLLVVTSPFVIPPTRSEVASLLEWVRRGGHVLLLLREGEEHPPPAGQAEVLLEALHLSRAEEAIGAPRVPLAYAGTEQLAHLTVGTAPGFAPPPLVAGPFVSLLERDGSTLCGTRTLGKGRLLLLATSAPLENDNLLQGTNLPFFASLLQQEREVHFDEYHHGYAAMPLSSLVRSRGFGLLMGQLALAGLLFLLASLRRDQPLRPAPEDRSAARSRRDYTSAMANLYARGRHTGHLADVLSTDLRSRPRTSARRSDAAMAAEEELARIVESGQRPTERTLLHLIRRGEGVDP